MNMINIFKKLFNYIYNMNCKIDYYKILELNKQYSLEEIKNHIKN